MNMTDTPASDPLLRYRDRFPILERTNYQISNSLGAMPAATRDQLVGYADQWAARGVRAWAEGWWEMAIQTGDLLAPILGVSEGEVCMHQNVTIASGVFLSAVDFRGKRNKLVMVDLEFPSLQYLYHQHPDAEIVTIRTKDGMTIDEDELLAAIDDKTALVAVSHVLFRSAYVLDAQALSARCREMGALLLLDVFQSAGTVPLQLKGWGVDAAVGGCLKWLCGGPGNCFLWVRPDLVNELEPRFTGWQAHPRPFAFEPGPIEFRQGIGRFLTGTPNIPALHAAIEGLKIVGDAGQGPIRQKSMHQTARLVELCDDRGWNVTAPRNPAKRGGTVAVDVPHALEVATELNARDICCDYRPGAGIRLSPHFYTRDDELDAAVDAVSEILETGAWQKHAGQDRTVT
jgi:kynureninase